MAMAERVPRLAIMRNRRRSAWRCLVASVSSSRATIDGAKRPLLMLARLHALLCRLRFSPCQSVVLYPRRGYHSKRGVSGAALTGCLHTRCCCSHPVCCHCIPVVLYSPDGP